MESLFSSYTCNELVSDLMMWVWVFVCVCGCACRSITGSLVLLLLKESESDRKAPERDWRCAGTLQSRKTWGNMTFGNLPGAAHPHKLSKKKESTEGDSQDTCEKAVWLRFLITNLNIHQNCRGHSRSPRCIISPEDGGCSRSLKAWKSEVQWCLSISFINHLFGTEASRRKSS